MQRLKWSVFAIIVGVCCHPAFGQAPAGTDAAPSAQHQATITKYCATCHNEKLKTGDMVLSNKNVANPSENAEAWEKVILKLKARNMPPSGAPRPDNATYEAMVNYFETSLDKAAEAKPNPGRPTAAHRLNRAEYVSAVRDLLALEIDGDSMLPADDSGGFDNLGDLLSVSPGLMEKYLLAAGKVSRLAVGNPNIKADSANYQVSPNLVQGDRMSEDLPFGTRGGMAVRHLFPLDGEYSLKVRLQRTEGAGFVIGIAEPHELDFRIDGMRVKLFHFGGEHVGLASGSGAADALPPDFKEAQYERTADDSLQVKFSAKAGTHLVQVAFLNDRIVPEGAFMKRPQATLEQARMKGENERGAADPSVSSISINGPFDARGSGDTPSRRKIFVCNSGQNAAPKGQMAALKMAAAGPDEDACARKILTNLARRAYRRTATDKDIAPLMKLFNAGRADGGFEAGIEQALQGVLVSTEFIFRIEKEPAGTAPDTPYRISDTELASRISYFLWGSLPDDELLTAAEKGKLKDPAVLEQQVKRMLLDPRYSKNMVDNFAGQWLYLRNVKTRAPNRDIYPEFDENLRDGFIQETNLFLESLFKEDKPVLNLLTADYTFLNDRLALHYGVPNIYGAQFRRVTLPDDARRGLLGQGSVLLLTALSNRTSVVQRGKWVLENIIGTPPPPPPPNVPPLKEKSEGAKGTLRQQMEAHRANPACFVCHSRMDPIGFAMENFDAIGKWRTTDDGAPIDSSGVLPDGSKFQGIAELRKAILNRPELVVNGATIKMLTFALGRQVEYYDLPAVRKIIRESAANDYRWSSIILGVVKSTPFQMRRSRPL